MPERGAPLAGELTRLFVLHHAGALTAPQFAAAKAAALGAGAPAAVSAAAPRRVAKGAGGIQLFVRAPGGRTIAVDLPADSSVGDLQAAVVEQDPSIRGCRLRWQDAELTDPSEVLADRGICSQATLDCAACWMPVWDVSLPHTGVSFSDDQTEMWGDIHEDTVTVLATCPLPASGTVSWSVKVLEHSSGSAYFGVGVTPLPQPVTNLLSQRIANDSTSTKNQGVGCSINQNGYCYGRWATQPSTTTESLSKGHEVLVQVTMPKGEVEFTVKPPGGARPRKTKGVLNVDGMVWYPAAFLQFGKGTRLKICPPHAMAGAV